ncbi:hypothetical protein HPB49_016449 [Dermacentor silvarum]|uniref:Uncharacterized protein n=1 Tax=Dermacentor silvarum TaxID=543639 RepID=A0ACB8E115_DERSI|nr:hypothetical protein HPB49_016449 [Dermacentor silvarum]
MAVIARRYDDGEEEPEADEDPSAASLGYSHGRSVVHERRTEVEIVVHRFLGCARRLFGVGTVCHDDHYHKQ